MEVLFRIVLGGLLVAHCPVHLMWFAPSDEPAWPFRLDRPGCVLWNAALLRLRRATANRAERSSRRL